MDSVMMDPSQLNTVNMLDYSVIGIYMLLILGVGFIFAKFNKDALDFFKGGNKIPWLVAGLSAFMSGFSAWTFTGAAGVAYNDGFAIVYCFMGNAVSFMAGYFLFASRWRRSRVTTNMEYLSARFDTKTRQTFSWTTVLFQIFMAGSMLYGMCVFFSETCGFSLTWTIIISGICIMVYCFMGGLWAVVITDFIQGTILLPFTIVLAGAALYQLGGIDNFFEGLANIKGLPAENHMTTISGVTEKSSWLYVACWTVMVTFGYNTAAHAQRYYSVDCEKSGKKIALLNIVLFTLGSCIWFIPPMAVRIYLPDLATMFDTANPHERSYVAACLSLLPNGLIGIMLAAMFSASMSTLSSYYNMHAAIITRDIYAKMIKTEMTEKQSLVVGRIATFGVGIMVTIIAVIMAQRDASVFETLLVFNTVISLAYGPAALLGLVFKNTPRWSGLVSFAISIVLGSILAFNWGAEFGFGLKEEAILITPVAIMSFFLSGLFVFKDGKANGGLGQRLAAFFAITLPVAAYLYIVGTQLYGWGQQELLVTIIPSCLVGLLVILFFGRDTQEKSGERDTFFEKLNTPIDLEKEVGETSDVGAIVFMFIFKVTAFLAILAVSFLIFNQEKFWVVLSYAGLTMAMALLYLVLSKVLKASIKK